MVLEKEQELFNQLKGDLLEHHKGKFVLIYGSSLIGIWDSQKNAYLNGIEQFGNVPFLIKQVVTEDPTEIVPALFIGVL